MVKIAVIAVVLATDICMADPQTNASSLVGIPLTTNEVYSFPSCDASTPDTVFLGIIRAMHAGNLPELYYHFEPNYLYSLTGYSTPSNIPAETISSFRSVMMDANFSNVVIAAYSISTSNRSLRISASLQENYTSRTITEPLTVTLSSNTNGWKIVAYDDDKWDE